MQKSQILRFSNTVTFHIYLCIKLADAVILRVKGAQFNYCSHALLLLKIYL